MRLLRILAVFIISGAMAGCCCKAENNARAGKEVIARINNYELTANDFRDEARPGWSSANMPEDRERAKQDALDELVIKKILLQEAQRQNFDKDAKFMKEIERYWEQALLKLLINKKIDEFSKEISPDIKGEIRQRMIQSELKKWLTDMRNSAKVKIYKENLKKVELK